MNKIMKKIMKNGLFVFIAPLIGYLFAYCYELGFLKYYKLNKDFAEVGLAELLFLGVLALVCVLFASTYLLKDEFKKVKKFGIRFKANLAIVILCAIPFFFYLILFGNIAAGIFSLEYLFLFLFFLITVLVIAIIITALSYIRKNKKDIKEEKKDSKSNKKFETILYIVVGTAAIIYFALCIYFGGYYSSKFKTIYLIIESENDNYIVITDYEEGYLVSDYNAEYTDGKYTYYELSEGDIVYTENIGRLEVINEGD